MDVGSVWMWEVCGIVKCVEVGSVLDVGSVWKWEVCGCGKCVEV